MAPDKLIPVAAVESAYCQRGFTRIDDFKVPGIRMVVFQGDGEVMFHPVVSDTDCVDLHDFLRDCGDYDNELQRDMVGYLINSLGEQGGKSSA